jgi:hypothetical protein
MFVIRLLFYCKANMAKSYFEMSLLKVQKFETSTLPWIAVALLQYYLGIGGIQHHCNSLCMERQQLSTQQSGEW